MEGEGVTEMVECIKAAVTRDWQTTKEIMREAMERAGQRTTLGQVYRVLASEERFGFVERRISPCGRMAEWRRRRCARAARYGSACRRTDGPPGGRSPPCSA